MASGFSALAAIELGSEAWLATHQPSSQVFMPPVAAAMALGAAAVLAATGAVLAARQRVTAGAVMLLGGAVTFASGAGVNLILVIGLLAMMAATSRPAGHSDPVA